MNFFRTLLITILLLFLSNFSLADSHNTNTELIEKAKEITQSIENNNEVEQEEDVPLNDPFAGNEGTNSSMNLANGEERDEMSLYNFKLSGLISGTDASYILSLIHI